MLLHSLRAFCKAPGGAGSISKYLEALARATGVSERFAYGFRTELHFADGQTKHSKLAAKDFETSEFHQNPWNHYLMIEGVLAYIPWNGISNVELQW